MALHAHLTRLLSVALLIAGCGSAGTRSSEPRVETRADEPAWATRLPRTFHLRIEGEDARAEHPQWGVLARIRLELRAGEGDRLVVAPSVSDWAGDVEPAELGVLGALHAHAFVVDARTGRFVRAEGAPADVSAAIAVWWNGWMSVLASADVEPRIELADVRDGARLARTLEPREGSCERPCRELVETLALTGEAPFAPDANAGDALVRIGRAMGGAAFAPAAEVPFAEHSLHRATTRAIRDAASGELLVLGTELVVQGAGEGEYVAATLIHTVERP